MIWEDVLSGAQHYLAVFSVILYCVKTGKVETINIRFGGSSTTFCNSPLSIRYLGSSLGHSLQVCVTVKRRI